MQFTPGLGVCPFKNNSLHVKNLIGGLSGVTAFVGFSVDTFEKSLDIVVTFNSSVIIGAITKTFQNLLHFHRLIEKHLDGEWSILSVQLTYRGLQR